ncbi:MAG TPA: hypothetical protein VG457_20365, partial [Planctomycetota bacterium]|nr:hypothetical protein [Planctomycetota bacterium]
MKKLGLMLILSIVAGVAVWAGTVPCLRCILTPTEYHPDPSSHGPERCGAGGPLKSLASAQADFRAGDRDHNGVEDFWVRDVAGLFTTLGVDGKPLRLIEQRLALADDRPASDLSALGTRAPYAGYWIRAIPHDGDNPEKPDRMRFAYVAFPVDFPRHQRDTLIIDENNFT